MMPAGIPISDADEDRQTGELKRDRQPRHDRVRDRQLALVDAEVAAQRETEPVDVLHRQRLVEPVVVPDRGEHRRVAVLAAERDRRVARAARGPRGRRGCSRGAGRSGRLRALRRRKPPMIVRLCLLLEAGELRRGSDRRRRSATPADLLRHAVAVDRVVEVDQRPVLDHLHRAPCRASCAPSSSADLRAPVRRVVELGFE